MSRGDPNAPFDIGHPAPGAERVRSPLLVIAFALAPLAWSVQLAAISSIAGVTCLGEEGAALAHGSAEWAQTAAIWINVGALTLAAAGLVLSIANLVRTRRAAHVPAGGVLESGEGRAHWMAVGGVFASVLFLAATAFNSVSVFSGGLCPS